MGKINIDDMNENEKFYYDQCIRALEGDLEYTGREIGIFSEILYKFDLKNLSETEKIYTEMYIDVLECVEEVIDDDDGEAIIFDEERKIAKKVEAEYDPSNLSEMEKKLITISLPKFIKYIDNPDNHTPSSWD